MPLPATTSTLFINHNPVAVPLSVADVAALYPPAGIQGGTVLYVPQIGSLDGQDGQVFRCVCLTDTVHAWIETPVGLGPITLVLVNRSARITNAQCRTMAAACTVQLQRDLPQLWPFLSSARMIFTADESILAGRLNYWPLYITDIPELGAVTALGFHNNQGDGLPEFLGMVVPFQVPQRPYALITTQSTIPAPVALDPFVPIPQQPKVAVVTIVSHEALEMMGDPFGYSIAQAAMPAARFCTQDQSQSDCTVVNTTEGAPHVTMGAIQELCDPVERSFYPIQIGNQPCWVQDFVGPQYFNPSYFYFLNPGLNPCNDPVPPLATIDAPAGTRLSFLNKIPAPYQLGTDGGSQFWFILGTTGMGPIIVPPAYMNPNPIYAKDCSMEVPPPNPPPGSARVALASPSINFGFGVTAQGLVLGPGGSHGHAAMAAEPPPFEMQRPRCISRHHLAAEPTPHRRPTPITWLGGAV
jgi:hypothetical protein